MDTSAPTITTGGGGKSSLAGFQLSSEIEAGALQVEAFLISYYGTENVSGAGEPAPTITTEDRLGLLTVKIQGTPYMIIDICLRMLQKHDYSAMRVDAESKYYAWEFEAIKDAILDGTLTYTPTLLRKAWPTIAERTCIDR